MKIYLLLLSSFLFSVSGHAQLAGTWKGKLSVQTSQLTIVFHLKQDIGTYQATMDVPEQGGKGIMTSSVEVNGKAITIKIDIIKGSYFGEITNDSTITGEWSQSGQKFPLVLIKQSNESLRLNRPQALKLPLPYESRDVYFENRTAAIKLAGTLTLPKENGNFPAVVLVSGSGPQNRDSEIFGHKPFEVIADYLTRNGIAVLRYDDRGIGKSEGDFNKATSFDFAEDAKSALEFLRKEAKINHKKIGLIGHSEGGMIGEIVGSGKDRSDFLVLLAAPAMDIDKLVLEQAKLIGEVSGTSPELVKMQIETNERVFKLLTSGVISDTIRKKIEEQYFQQINTVAKGAVNETVVREQAAKAVQGITTPWFITFINFKPQQYLGKLYGPVLALNGSKDLQVPAKQNLDIMREVMGKSKKVKLTAIELPGLNHLFQTAKTGSPSEYEGIAETFSPDALKIISDWVLAR